MFKKTVRIVSLISSKCPEIASAISLEFIIIDFGKPESKSLPLTSASVLFFCGIAEPISIFIFSAVCSPIAKLYFFFTYSIIASSNLLPATLKDAQETIPPKEITATSEVPPPILTIK